MTAGYFPWDVCNQVSLKLENWCAQYTTPDQATRISAGALAATLACAMEGRRTVNGPYRSLFAWAEFEMRVDHLNHVADIPFGIWRTIPDPGEHVLCEFTRAYACAYMGAGLTPLTELEKLQLHDAVRQRTHSLEGHWFLPADGVEPAALFALVERISLAWDQHDHSPVGCCEDCGSLWTHEHNRAHEWHVRWLSAKRGNRHGLTQQTDRPRHNRSPFADDHIHLDRAGGEREPESDLWFAPGRSPDGHD